MTARLLSAPEVTGRSSAPTVGRLAMTERFAGVWWISPVGAVCLLCPLTLLIAWLTPDRIFEVEFGEVKSLTGHTVVLAATGLVAFIVGALLPELKARSRVVPPARWPITDPVFSSTLRRAEPILFALTMLGYLLFIGIAVVNGLSVHQLVNAVLSQDSALDTPKAAFQNVTGLTSLTQVGMAYVVVAMLVLATGSTRGVRARLVLLLFLAFARSFLVSERLAIIELLVPVLVVGASRVAAGGTGARRLLARAAPLVLFPILFVGFGALEYSRSYAFYAPRTHESLAGFTLHRLTGYYVTSFNNGQLSLDFDRYPGRLPYGLLQGFWTAPGITQLGGYERATGVDYPALYTQILTLHGNPEFNSQGGLLEPFVDVGIVGGLIFFLVAGFVLASAYRRYCAGDRLGLLLYPSLVTGMFELPRYIYWTEGRYVPSLAALLVVAWWRRPGSRSRASDGRQFEMINGH